MSSVMYCEYCGSHKHTIKNCPKTWGGSVKHTHMRCGYCGSKKHNTKACPKTWGGNAARAWHPETVKDDFVED